MQSRGHNRHNYECSKDIITQQPSSGELRLCELSQKLQIYKLKEAQSGAPNLGTV